MALDRNELAAAQAHLLEKRRQLGIQERPSQREEEGRIGALDPLPGLNDAARNFMNELSPAKRELLCSQITKDPPDRAELVGPIAAGIVRDIATTARAPAPASEQIDEAAPQPVPSQDMVTACSRDQLLAMLQAVNRPLRNKRGKVLHEAWVPMGIMTTPEYRRLSGRAHCVLTALATASRRQTKLACPGARLMLERLGRSNTAGGLKYLQRGIDELLREGLIWRYRGAGSWKPWEAGKKRTASEYLIAQNPGAIAHFKALNTKELKP